jgi:hypothetical protein
MKIRILTAAIAVLSSSVSFAQSELSPDTFKVVKEYQPTLIDANKFELHVYEQAASCILSGRANTAR